MGDPRAPVRGKALVTLSDILRTHGSLFSPQTWGLMFRGVINPVFENAITDPTPPLSSEWPGQEQDPREVLALAVAAAEEEDARRAAVREAEQEELAAKKVKFIETMKWSVRACCCICHVGIRHGGWVKSFGAISRSSALPGFFVGSRRWTHISMRGLLEQSSDAQLTS